MQKIRINQSLSINRIQSQENRRTRTRNMQNLALNATKSDFDEVEYGVFLLNTFQ